MKLVSATVAIGRLAVPTVRSGVPTCRYTASPVSRAQLSLIQSQQAPFRQGKATRHSLSLHAADTDVESVIELEVKVTGLQCGGCVDRVVEALQAMPEVVVAKVDLSTGVATVDVSATDQFDAAMRVLPAVVQAVRDLGFEAEPHFED